MQDYSDAAVRNAGNRALELLVSVLREQQPEDDVYALALATYALHVADHPYKDTAFFMMEARAKVKGLNIYYRFIISEVTCKFQIYY